MTSYKMFYVEDTEDYFFRKRPTANRAHLAEQAKQRDLAKWTAFLAKHPKP